MKIIEQIKDLVKDVPGEVIKYGCIVLAAILLLKLISRSLARLRGGKKQSDQGLSKFAIQVKTLGLDGPPPGGPTLEFFNVPMRLAGVVIAPLGRVASLPPDPQLAGAMDLIVPGLSKIFNAHRPKVYRWPAQVSAAGFVGRFFAEVILPGDHGKGSNWSVVGGRVKSGDTAMLVGLVLCAAGPNNLGQFTIESEAKWLDVLRIKD